MVTLFGLTVVAIGLAVPVGLFVVCLYEVYRRRRRKAEHAMLQEQWDQRLEMHRKMNRQYLEGRMSEVKGFDWDKDEEKR